MIACPYVTAQQFIPRVVQMTEASSQRAGNAVNFSGWLSVKGCTRCGVRPFSALTPRWDNSFLSNLFFMPLRRPATMLPCFILLIESFIVFKCNGGVGYSRWAWATSLGYSGTVKLYWEQYIHNVIWDCSTVSIRLYSRFLKNNTSPFLYVGFVFFLVITRIEYIRNTQTTFYQFYV